MGREVPASQWFKVTLPGAECTTKGKILQNDFETLYTINATPKDAALFGSKDVEHCFFYFSPGAVAIASGLIQHFGGVPFPAPAEDEHSPLLLVGHADALEMLSKSPKNLKSRPKRVLDQILGRN
jgi:hypothetical protein